MNIKEIAPKLTQKLSIAINDDEAVEFAEALIAEIQKQNEPVVWWNKDTCQFFIGEIADVERKDLFEPLYALPPTTSQIEQRVAEAIHDMTDEVCAPLQTDDKSIDYWHGVGAAAVAIENAISNGEYRKFVKEV